MEERPVYSRDELMRLRCAALRDEPLACPHCRVPLIPREIQPGSGTAYVRTRVWWLCPACRRSVVLDQKRPDG